MSEEEEREGEKRRRAISSEGAPRAIGPYSQGVESRGFIFLSGQIPLDPRTGNIEGRTIEEQTRRVMENLRAGLAAGGSDLSRVLRCTVFLADLSDFSAFNQVYGSFFPSDPPARTTVQVSRLPRDAKVEIDVIAEK
jgi:2-iminobutanoate/2-iminopropanoate deaminase